MSLLSTSIFPSWCCRCTTITTTPPRARKLISFSVVAGRRILPVPRLLSSSSPSAEAPSCLFIATATTAVPPIETHILPTTTTSTTATIAATTIPTTRRSYHASSHAPFKIVDYVPFKRLDGEAVSDLFQQYAQIRNGVPCLDAHDVCRLLRGIGETKHADDEAKIEQLFRTADLDGNGVIDLEEFLENAYTFIGDNPARIILVIGGPGSGKGVLSRKLEEICGVVHLSSGNLLRDEVERDTPLGRQVKDIMAQGQLVSSAIMVALIKKHMRDHPGKRVLLDGFPRSLQNAYDLVTLCGKPEMALQLLCDDTILMERIMKRGENRLDDNFDTALNRIRTFHRYSHLTLEWLKENHVPVVNLDATGSPESVWHQMTAIGKLMRPAVKLGNSNIQPP